MFTNLEGFCVINKYSNVPLYSQLKQLIIEKIESGDYPVESKIPSEQELRGTIRHKQADCEAGYKRAYQQWIPVQGER